MGRRTPGMVEITNMSIEEEHGSLFSLSEQHATINGQSYIRIRVTYESPTDPQHITRVDAVIRMENDVRASLSVPIKFISEAPIVNLPTLVLNNVHGNGKCAPENPCGACVGDCDEGDLKCFRRNSANRYEPIPGCTGTGGRATDYCYKEPGTS